MFKKTLLITVCLLSLFCRVALAEKVQGGNSAHWEAPGSFHEAYDPVIKSYYFAMEHYEFNVWLEFDEDKRKSLEEDWEKAGINDGWYRIGLYVACCYPSLLSNLLPQNTLPNFHSPSETYDNYKIYARRILETYFTKIVPCKTLVTKLNEIIPDTIKNSWLDGNLSIAFSLWQGFQYGKYEIEGKALSTTIFFNNGIDKLKVLAEHKFKDE